MNSPWVRQMRPAISAVRNPWDVTRVPGGSSGGSAAAVCARLAPAATATDTGGSIRQPAALCGVTGMKPTYGRVSALRHDHRDLASSLDQGGLITQTAEDAAMLLQAMAGFDPRDSTSVELPVPDYAAGLNRRSRLKVGVLREFFEDWIRRSVCACGADQGGDRCAARRPPWSATSSCRPTCRCRCRRTTSWRQRSALGLARFDDAGTVRAILAICRICIGARVVRIRAGGKAPDHDRYLRAVGGLLRCVLSQGPARPPADPKLTTSHALFTRWTS